jgi:chloramphenicol O-acetyltransferase type A
MPIEVNPKETSRAAAYELWMRAPNPMVTFFKTIDVTELRRTSRKRKLKFNMLMDYCIGKAAASVKEFYLLPVGDKLMRFDTIAVNTIVRNKIGEVSSCDILFTDYLEAFHREYLYHTGQVAETCVDIDSKRNNNLQNSCQYRSAFLSGVLACLLYALHSCRVV